MVLSKRDYFTMEYQVEKLNNVLIYLDILDKHGLNVLKEIEVLEMLQNRIIKRIENKEGKIKNE